MSNTNPENYSEGYPQGKYSYMWTGVKTIRRLKAKIGRNDMCPCGSSLKFKNCCERKTNETRW